MLHAPVPLFAPPVYLDILVLAANFALLDTKESIVPPVLWDTSRPLDQFVLLVPKSTLAASNALMEQFARFAQLDTTPLHARHAQWDITQLLLLCLSLAISAQESLLNALNAPP